MSEPRIPPRGPIETKSEHDEFISKGRGEKVGEVDPDDTRKKKFQKLYEGELAEKVEARVDPFDLMGKPLSKIEKDAKNVIVPSPSYCPPPRVSSMKKGGEEENPLPNSKGFWQKVDSLPDQKIPVKNFQETSDSTNKGKKRNVDTPQTNPSAIQIQPPSLSPLPASASSMAEAATAQAAPYIQPQTIDLFYALVGVMYVMNESGVSRTEIVLNNPAYANSVFFGTIIKVEKYTTAPDSFNITLSGSNQAVGAFRDNIPSLMAAFQEGRFAFKVTRLEAVYSAEKPVFHRKEKGKK